LGNDRHIIINRTNRLDASTPHFEMVYSRPGRPEVNRYSGHVNQAVAEQSGHMMDVADLFPDERAEVKLPPRHYMVMGDNTLSSYDSRAWGSFPRGNVIGRSFFVYWPIGSQPGRAPRFGWGHR
jgi:signal peptidase I